jgi:CHAT domain-containing protein/tetratricopeptide (TPR) repeat protein
VLSNLSLIGQDVDVMTEVKQGKADINDKHYASALLHFERVAEIIPPTVVDDNIAASIYQMCGVCATEIGDIEKSIKYNEKALTVFNFPLKNKVPILFTLLNDYYEMSLSEKYEETLAVILDIYKTNKTLDVYSELINHYNNCNRYEDTIKLENDLSNIIIPGTDTEFQKMVNSIQLGTLYMGLGYAFLEMQDYDKVIKYCGEAIAYQEINGHEASIPGIYNAIATAYMKKGDNTTALKYQKLAVGELNDDISLSNNDVFSSADKEQLDNDLRSQANRLLQLGDLYIENGRYQESIDYLEEADRIYIQLGDVDEHAYTLYRMYAALHAVGNLERCEKIKNDLIAIFEKHEIGNTEKDMLVSDAIGLFYKDEGDYVKALEIFEMNIEKRIDYYGENNINLFYDYYKIASIYLVMSDLSNTAIYLDKLKLLFPFGNDNSDNYYSMLFLECNLLSQLGQDGKAIALLEGVANKIESASNLELKSEFYNCLSNLYISIGDTIRVLDYDKKSLELCKESKGTTSESYVIALLNSAEVNNVMKNNSDALKLVYEACEIAEKLYGKKNKLYYQCLYRLSDILYDEEKRKDILSECLALSQTLFGDNSIEYADAIIFNIGFPLPPTSYDLEMYRNALEIKRNLNKDNDIEYIYNLSRYAYLLCAHKDWLELYTTLSNLVNLVRQYIQSNFTYLPGNQRSTMWNRIVVALDVELLINEYYRNAIQYKNYNLLDKFGELAYDVRLLKKGLLLTSTRRLDSLIGNSQSHEISVLNHQIANLRLKLNQIDNEDKEHIERDIKNLERQVIEIVSPNGEFTDFTQIRWSDIQSSLKLGEVAIEFFCDNEPVNRYYYAICCGVDFKPMIFKLFCEKEIEKYKIGGETIYDYENVGMYNAIWANLNNFFNAKNVHTIYFSADGIINTISIENLSDSSGLLCSEKYHIYRLSSTRELVANNKIRTKPNKVVLYGGLDFDATVDELELANKMNSVTNTLPSARIANMSSLRTLRNRAEYLSWTLAEVKSISSMIESSNCKIYTGANGTEESFKSLVYKVPSILHIATHGFFYEPEDIQDIVMSNPNGYNFLRYGYDNKPSVETLAMRGTGLLFSGANLALTGKFIPENLSDGILTAEELSKLDLIGVDIAVLSACETGLGTTTEDGVFGLQRGFKLAGVNSLLMSLWKVDDKATSILMNAFYSNLLQGVSRTQSLKLAQETLRTASKYSHPIYWAGWILLDAIE